MSHFVQRLLARHLGPVSQPAAGSVMMLPRMASRFEGLSPALEVEHDGAEVQSKSAVGQPVAPPAQTLGRPPSVVPSISVVPKAVQQTLENPAIPETPGRHAALSQASADSDRVFNKIVTVRETNPDGKKVAEPGGPTSSTSPLPLAAFHTAGVAPETSSFVDDVRPEPMNTHQEQQQQTSEREAPIAVSSLQQTPQVLTPTAEAIPPPQISIGRIDVQFLPPPTPAVPQRPVAQRTRGFDAYANARRGLVR